MELTNAKRRIFLKLSLQAGVSVMSLVATGRLLGKEAVAEWLAPEFDSAAAGDIVTGMLKGKSAEESSLIQVVVPEICENRALVPVSFHTGIQDVRAVSLIVDGVSPVVGNFKLSAFKCDRISTRVRVERDTRIWALAATEEKFYISHAAVALKKFQCAPDLEN